MSGHIEDRLGAWLDGELADDEARAFAEHVEGCSRCARAADDARRVANAIESDAPAAQARPMWPYIERRLGASPAVRFDPVFAAATAAALAAGVLLGVWTFDRPAGPVFPAASGSTESDWTESAGPTLADIYLGESPDDGGNAAL